MNNQSLEEKRILVKNQLQLTNHRFLFNVENVNEPIENYFRNKHLLGTPAFFSFLKFMNDPLHHFIKETLSAISSEEDLVEVIMVLELLIIPNLSNETVIDEKVMRQDYAQLKELNEKSILITKVLADLQETIIMQDEQSDFNYEVIKKSLQRLNVRASRCLQKSRFKLRLLLLKTAINKSDFTFASLN